MKSRGHETMEHAADMGIRGWGATVPEAFEEVAAAMVELMIDRDGLVPSNELKIGCDGADPVELLLEFLNEILAEADLAGLAVLSVKIKEFAKEKGQWELEAVARGVPIAGVRDRLLVEVKAATIYGASVKEEKPGRWVAQCVVDL